MRLIVSDLACERGGRLLFSELSFTLEAGNAVALTGANGAGKTSLLSLIAGLLRSHAGEIRLEDGQGLESEIPEEAHLVGHRDGLKSQLLVRENLEFWQAMLPGPPGLPPGLTPLAALARLGLAHVEGTPGAYLSAGQRRRVALARLLVAPRTLWLLDEPTAALDAAARKLLAGLMEEHLATGGLIIAATHEPLGIKATEIRIGA
ncbi:heme exporter protein A [Rhizobiales bacterium GAS191]|nr:heme exporter protein A [Rhizobiales bacterium GAS113]SEB77174.1 heme exporter protein A [Rhizobiales bacterium GAS188]SED50506.1 heme exporter protein A [Rhizobiales bacterium GAS191]